MELPYTVVNSKMFMTYCVDMWINLETLYCRGCTLIHLLIQSLVHRWVYQSITDHNIHIEITPQYFRQSNYKLVWRLLLRQVKIALEFGYKKLSSAPPPPRAHLKMEWLLWVFKQSIAPWPEKIAFYSFYFVHLNNISDIKDCSENITRGDFFIFAKSGWPPRGWVKSGRLPLRIGKIWLYHPPPSPWQNQGCQNSSRVLRTWSKGEKL